MANGSRLSVNLLAEIIGRFGARLEPDSATRNSEGWRFPLHRCKAVAQTQFGGDHKEYVAIEIVDLSTRGIGFRTEVPVTKGATLTVILRIPGIPLQTWNCRVVNVHSFDGKEYRAGAMFENGTAANGNSSTAARKKNAERQS